MMKGGAEGHLKGWEGILKESNMSIRAKNRKDSRRVDVGGALGSSLSAALFPSHGHISEARVDV